jgi:hypothetical protein
MNTQNTNSHTGISRQQDIVRELCETHGLDPSQISFDADGETPIFDYEAVCALSLKLTDINAIDCKIVGRHGFPVDGDGSYANVSTAECTVILPDGKSRTVQDSAFVGELIGPDMKVETTARCRRHGPKPCRPSRDPLA